VGINITAYNGGRTTHEIEFTDADGEAVAIGSNNVRIKIGRAGATPILDIRDGTDLGGGGNVTRANPAVLTLYRDDISASIIKPGVYDIEAYIVDATDDNKIVHAESGVFKLIDGMRGATD
jgi:hypothetical protein